MMSLQRVPFLRALHRGLLCRLLALAALVAVAMPGTAAGTTATTTPRAESRQREEPVRQVMDLGLMDERHMATIIESAYRTLQDFTRGELVLEVGDVQTFYPEQFGGIAWLDVVDMPDGRLVDVDRHVRQATVPGLKAAETRWVIYRAKWRSQDQLWLSTPWGKSLTRMSVAEVLREIAAKRPELLAVKAISSVAVTARLQGESRTYRAAFLWIPAGSTTQTTFVPVDNVVQNLDAAVREADPPAPRELGRSRFRVFQKPQGQELENVYKDAATCQTGSTYYQDQQYASSAEGHITGSHRSAAGFYQTCTCQSDCTQSCSTEITSSSCIDDGLPYICHQTATSSSGGSSVAFGTGNVAPASCGAGFGCVEKACLFCVCSLSIGVSASGPSVTWSVGGSPDWNGSLQFSHTCAPCSTVTPPPPPGGGGGGGGGGSCGGCDCDGDGWVTPLECVYQCGGTVDGEWCDLF